jgi:transcriptional regulator with XRE-family HTH domain
MKNIRIMLLTNPSFTVSDDIAEQLPKRVIELRKAAGLTQADLADSIGIKLARYGHYERGFRRFPVSIIPKLAEALGCTEADLLGVATTSPKKRGPASRLELLAGRLGSLPRTKQSMILDMMEGAIDKAS